MHFHLEPAALLVWCGAPAGAVPLLLFLTGLIGGLAHCGPMCGPFVLAQAAALPAGGSVVRRLAGGLLLSYHLGRLLTYAALGAAAAALGASIVALAPVRLAVAMLLGGAALLFAAQAAARLMPARPAQRIAIGWADRLAGVAEPLLEAPTATRRFALGAVLGLLPCGFLYGALAAAAATGDPIAGAAAMAAFGAGTVPSLVLVGMGGAALSARWRGMARRALAPLFLFNAAALGALALSVAVSP